MLVGTGEVDGTNSVDGVPTPAEEVKESNSVEGAPASADEMKSMFSAFRDEIMAGVSSVVEQSSSLEEQLRKEYDQKLSQAEAELKEKDEMLEQQSQSLTSAKRKIAELEKEREEAESLKKEALKKSNGSEVEYIDIATYKEMLNTIEELKAGIKKYDDVMAAWERDNDEKMRRFYEEMEMRNKNNNPSDETLDLSQKDTTVNIKSDNKLENSNVDNDKTESDRSSTDMVGRTLSITDSNGRVISSLPIEHSVKKSSGLGGIAAALGIKKRSRRSMMQMAINGELSKEQLILIVEAIKGGLTETQLCNLIENKVSAERMPQIIEIAKLENEMGYNE